MKNFQWQIWLKKKIYVWLDWESISGRSLDHFINATEYSSENSNNRNPK